MRRGPIALLALGMLAVSSTLSPAPASAGAGPHPCFNDQGTIPWYRSLAEAQAAARASGKLIFIESGRLECSQCRRLVSGILPYEPVRSRMSAVAVGLADDCDESSPAVRALLDANLPNATMLPLVGFVTPDLRWVTGWSGGTMVGNVQQQLSVAEQWQRQIAPARASFSASSPCSTPSAVRPAPTPAAPAIAPRASGGFAGTATPLVSPSPSPATPSPMPMPTPLARSTPAPAPAPRATPLPAPSPAAPAAPFTPPLAARPAPAPTAPLVTPPLAPPSAALPSRSSATPPAMLAAPPAAAIGPVLPPTTRPHSPIERARDAAAREAWGEVLRIADGEDLDADSRDAAELSGLVDRACAWTLRTMLEAERLAADRKTADARRTLERMRHELDGTQSPVLVDADRGLHAMDMLTTIEAGSPDGPDGVETLRRRAYAEFRGSRWAPLFRSR